MKFINTKIKDCFVVELEQKSDERGFLARVFDYEEFKKLGINLNIVEGYMTKSLKKGTMRGIHYQVAPHAEYKLTKVTKGSIFEVVIDLRKDCDTFGKIETFELKDSDYKMLIIPPNCGHGLLTLQDDTEFINFYDRPFNSEFERGIRFDDPKFNINWPISVTMVSDKDKSWEAYVDNR